MDYTPTHKLKKPAPEDFYDIQDFNDNTDIIEAELEKREPAKVANNLTTTAEGFVLDARQGKVLNDKLVKLDADTVKTADKATSAEAIAGEDDTKWMTPLKTKQCDDAYWNGYKIKVIDVPVPGESIPIVGNRGYASSHTSFLVKDKYLVDADGGETLSDLVVCDANLKTITQVPVTGDFKASPPSDKNRIVEKDGTIYFSGHGYGSYVYFSKIEITEESSVTWTSIARASYSTYSSYLPYLYGVGDYFIAAGTGKASVLLDMAGTVVTGPSYSYFGSGFTIGNNLFTVVSGTIYCATYDAGTNKLNLISQISLPSTATVLDVPYSRKPYGNLFYAIDTTSDILYKIDATENLLLTEVLDMSDSIPYNAAEKDASVQVTNNYVYYTAYGTVYQFDLQSKELLNWYAATDAYSGYILPNDNLAVGITYYPTGTHKQHTELDILEIKNKPEIVKG